MHAHLLLQDLRLLLAAPQLLGSDGCSLLQLQAPLCSRLVLLLPLT